MQDERVGFVLRDPLGRQPDQPIPESLGLRLKLSDGAIFDLGIKKDGTALMIRMVPGSKQAIGYADMGIFPQVSNVVLIRAVSTGATLPISNLSREDGEQDE